MYILFVAVFVLLLYLFQYNIYKNRWSDDLKADAFFSVSEAYEGDDAYLTETIENAKLLPLPMVKMKLQLSKRLRFKSSENSKVSDFFYRTDMYNIRSYQKITRTLKFNCAQRGYYDFHGVDVLASDLFLSKEFIKEISTSSCLYVYPKRVPADVMEPILNRINGETLTKRNLLEDPFELRGIREYQTFDSMKNINWKASAKTDDLMSNVHDYTSKRTIRIFLNLEDPLIMKQEEIMELCMSMALATASNYAGESVPVSLYANTRDVLDDKYIELEEGSGENFVRGAARALARVDLKKDCYHFGDIFTELLLNASDDTYTVIISPYMQDDFQDLLIKFREMDREFCWICPKYSETRLSIKEEIRGNVSILDAREALYEASNC